MIRYETPVLRVEQIAVIGSNMRPAGIVWTRNRCCPGEPVIIVRSRTGFAAQCTCGGSCRTSWRPSPAAALAEWAERR